MKDTAEPLIRQALGRRPPPTLGPTLVDDVMQRVVASPLPAAPGGRAAARQWLAAATWSVTGVASVAVLAHLEWSSGSKAVTWGLALAMVPLTYAAALWPHRALGLLAVWGETLAPRR
jgi:hypothetical protein